MRYNRIEGRFCWVIPRVKDFGISFCFRRLAFERPVVPFALLPLSGWNTVTCSLVFTPPVGGGCCPALPPYRWGVSLARKALFLLWESGVFLLCSCFLPAQLGPQPSRWRLRRLTDGAYPLRVKPLFLLHCKRKSGSGLRKRKGRPVEILGWCGTTG